MPDFDDLNANIARLEQHIESQDIEVYRQQRLINALQKQLKNQEERIQSLEQGGGADHMPADEKPPHY